MFQKILKCIILTNTFLFFILYSNLRLDINESRIEIDSYSLFRKEELYKIKLVKIKNSFFYRKLLSEKIDLIKKELK
tara:strand:+ start:613 stop:843 length:231 start_codon:yes stop_codon:yes gene_type:complete